MKGYFAPYNPVDLRTCVFVLKWGQWGLQTILYALTGHQYIITIEQPRAILY